MTQPLVTAPTVVWTKSDQSLRLVLAPPTGHYGPKAVFIFEEGAVDVMGQTGWRSQADDCNKQRRCENLELVLCDVIAECRRLANECASREHENLERRKMVEALRAERDELKESVKEAYALKDRDAALLAEERGREQRLMAEQQGRQLTEKDVDQIIDVANAARLKGQSEGDLIYYCGELMTRKRAAELAKAAGGH